MCIAACVCTFEVGGDSCVSHSVVCTAHVIRVVHVVCVALSACDFDE